MALKVAGGAGRKKYKLGDQWSNDFDYDGMLAMFRMALAGQMSVPDMERLSDSMEDVNYHTDNLKLRAVIDGKKVGKDNPAALTQAIGKIVNDGLLLSYNAWHEIQNAGGAAQKIASMISNNAADDAAAALKLYQQAQQLLKKADGLMTQAYKRGTNLGGK